MSMTRQMALLIAALLALACCGVWVLQLGWLRGDLRAQVHERNVEAAALLARLLAPLQGDAAQLRAAVDSRFAEGRFLRVTLRAADGQLIAERIAPPADQATAPRWFVVLVALNSEAARAPIGDAAQRVESAPRPALPAAPRGGMSKVAEPHLLMSVTVATREDWAHGVLWSAASRTALWLGSLLAVGGLVAAGLLRRWQGPLQQIALQARALQEGRFQFIAEPGSRDLRPVVKSMNTLVARLAEQFAAQSSQVHTLQRLAHADAVTGLARREAFLRRVCAFAEVPECPGMTLVMLRLRNLAQLNESAGHANVDSFLGAVGDMLDDYPRRVNGALAGRLNGIDLSVFLPARGVARDTSEAIADTLAALAERSLPGLEFAIGATESLGPLPLAELLAACDTALAQAEWRSQGRSGGAAHDEVVVRLLGNVDDGSDIGPTSGSRGWRTRISAALEAGRVDVAEFPVLDRHGKLIHLECPLRVQPEAAGPVLAAREWLPWASRSALLPRLEGAGLVKVLERIAADGQRRALHLCESSIVQSGAVQALTAVLDEHRLAARLLCVEISEATWARAPAPLAALGAALLERGVTIGMEHAGLALPWRSFVQGIVLAYVKVDARCLHGAAGDLVARDLPLALVRQARSLGALVIAEGVAEPQEIDALFALGFDGVTGPGVQLQD